MLSLLLLIIGIVYGVAIIQLLFGVFKKFLKDFFSFKVGAVGWVVIIVVSCAFTLYVEQKRAKEAPYQIEAPAVAETVPRNGYIKVQL